MLGEIRLFLIVRRANDLYNVYVHRKAIDLRSEWDRECLADPNASGLVHAGDSRPDTDEFSQLLESFPGKILVSEAAKWLLAPDFAEHTWVAGYLLQNSSQRAMPIYLASKGWGYESESIETEDIATAVASASVLQGNTVQTPDQDLWLAALSLHSSSLKESLQRFGITSDVLYVNRRNQLSANIRNEVDQFRYEYLLNTINSTDPFQIARIAPLESLEISFSEIEMTVRCQNVLKDNGLQTVADLLSYDLFSALRWKNFGKKSVGDLAEALKVRIADGLKTQINLNKKNLDETSTQELTLYDEIEATISSMEDNYRSVFTRRLGYKCQKQTLEEIGLVLGVTRERVRQIEKKCFEGKLARAWMKAIPLKIEGLLNQRTDPLYLDLIEIEDNWFRGFSDDLECLASLIDTFSEDRYKVFKIDMRKVVSTINEDEWSELKKEATTYLKTRVNSGMTEADVRLSIEATASSKGASELGKALYNSIKDSLHYAVMQEGGEAELSGVGKGVIQYVTTVLSQANQPLHYSEIGVLCRARAGREIPTIYIRNTLATIGALYYGRGTFGTMKHFPFSSEMRKEILEEIENIVLDHETSRQWHTSELLDALGERRPDLPETLDKYLLNIILGKSELLTTMGRMVWTAVTSEEHITRGRIDLKEACESILEKSGRPMATDEIHREIAKIRGIGDYFFIQPSRKLARIAPGVWGLVDRDFLISTDERSSLLDTLYLVLLLRQKGLHVSRVTNAIETENCSVPAGFTDYMIMSLAQTDDRFSVRRGQIISLTEWPDERLPTLRQAVASMSESLNEPTTLPAILTRLESIIERRVLQNELYGLLREFNIVFDPTTRSWSKQIDDSEDEALAQPANEELINVPSVT
jgi:hypothetical protein